MYERFIKLSNRTIILIFVGLFLISALLSLLVALQSSTFSFVEWTDGLLLNFSSEMLGAIATFVLLYLLVERRDKIREEKKQENDLKDQLLRQLLSVVHDEKVRAAEELRLRGWLEDETLLRIRLLGADLSDLILIGANLRGLLLLKINLHGTDLRRANMTHAIMRGANLSRAILIDPELVNPTDINSMWIGVEKGEGTIGSNIHKDLTYRAILNWAVLENVDLHGTYVDAKQLAQVQTLRGATMPDGSRYNGCFNLSSDIFHAKQVEEIDVTSPKAMAKYYGVTIKSYLNGQELARVHSKKLEGWKKDRPAMRDALIKSMRLRSWYADESD